MSLPRSRLSGSDWLKRNFRITHRFRETRKNTLDKKRYDKTTTRLQSSLDSTIESRFFSRVSIVQSRLVSHNRDSILTIESHFFSRVSIVQSRLVSHNRDSILTIESHFSQSSLFSHNRVSILTIESRFTQSSLVSHNRVSFHTIECIEAKGTRIEFQRRKFTNGDWYRESIREKRSYGKR